MVFFLAFLVLTTIVLPIVTLSKLGLLALSLVFALTLTFGAIATIQNRTLSFIVIALTVTTFGAGLAAEAVPTHGLRVLDTTLRLCCLSILIFMTLKRTLRPGRVTGYRVAGGIAGYLLIGFVWAYAYQLLVLQKPGAVRFESGSANMMSQQPRELIYFSFVTLTTVGYGDAQPIHPVARSLAIAEALVGQLYLAILIASLVGMALQGRSETGDGRKDQDGVEINRTSALRR